MTRFHNSARPIKLTGLAIAIALGCALSAASISRTRAQQPDEKQVELPPLPPVESPGSAGGETKSPSFMADAPEKFPYLCFGRDELYEGCAFWRWDQVIMSLVSMRAFYFNEAWQYKLAGQVIDYRFTDAHCYERWTQFQSVVRYLGPNNCSVSCLDWPRWLSRKRMKQIFPELSGQNHNGQPFYYLPFTNWWGDDPINAMIPSEESFLAKTMPPLPEELLTRAKARKGSRQARQKPPVSATGQKGGL